MGTIAISGGSISHDCIEVAGLMRFLRINGDVTKNISVLDGEIEHGCRIRVAEPAQQNIKLLCGKIQTLLEPDCILLPT